MEKRNLTPHSIRKIEDQTRTMEFVISDNTLDSHGTILSPGGWQLDRFQKNGIFSYQHNALETSDPDFILGSATAFLEGDKLIGIATFETADINPLAEKIFRKVKSGTLKAVSVGFIGKKSHREGDIIIFDEMELIEFSIVNIASNPNAVKRGLSEKNRKYNYILNYL